LGPELSFVQLVIAVFRVKIASSGESVLAVSDEITFRALHVGADQIYGLDTIPLRPGKSRAGSKLDLRLPIASKGMPSGRPLLTSKSASPALAPMRSSLELHQSLKIRFKGAYLGGREVGQKRLV